MDLSLKGIARKYGGKIGNFSVTTDIFNGAIGTQSLRSKLELMAREEHSFYGSECKWTNLSSFEQVWTHITVRVKLNPDADIPAAEMNELQIKWGNAIRNTWSNIWGCSREGELSCRLTFEIQWVTINEHYTVNVRQDLGEMRPNRENWPFSASNALVIHEFGHMLALPDEYWDERCPDRNPVNTETIMDNSNNPNNLPPSEFIPSRLMDRFANNIGSNVVAI